mgnify:CR=1 FL=1
MNLRRPFTSSEVQRGLLTGDSEQHFSRRRVKQVNVLEQKHSRAWLVALTAGDKKKKRR